MKLVSAPLMVNPDRIRKVSNVQNVPFSYRDNRSANKQFGGISLPIPITVHLQNLRSATEEDVSWKAFESFSVF